MLCRAVDPPPNAGNACRAALAMHCSTFPAKNHPEGVVGYSTGNVLVKPLEGRQPSTVIKVLVACPMVLELNLCQGSLYCSNLKETMRGCFLVYWNIWDFVWCRNEYDQSAIKGIHVWYCKTRCVMAWSVVGKQSTPPGAGSIGLHQLPQTASIGAAAGDQSST